jgi:hypothetical protein
MAFPHKTAAFPELAKVVNLPVPTSAMPVRRRRVRRA